MLLYSIIMAFGAILFAVLGRAVYNGRTNLINDYHQTRVTDQAAYGRAFGKALFVFSAAMLLSGIAELFGDSRIAVFLLIAGMAVGVVCIVLVQKKYNGGVF